MPEDLPARLTDALAEWIISETEAGISAMLDGLGLAELQFLAGALNRRRGRLAPPILCQLFLAHTAPGHAEKAST